MTSSAPIRIGVQLQPQHAPHYGNIRDAVRRCEDIGVDVVFNWDHFFPLYGDPDGAHFECWTMLGAWAEQTSRIEIGALVTCNSYRNPELLADMARTVDHISDGRLILGIGSGWKQKDYDEYGYEFGTAGSRLDDLARRPAADQVPAGQAQPGAHPRHPDPDRRRGRRRRCAWSPSTRDIWHGFTNADDLPGKPPVLAEHCAAVGRDPAASNGRPAVDDGAAAPRLIADAEALTGLGVTLLTIGVNGPDYDLSGAEALCRWRDRA